MKTPTLMLIAGLALANTSFAVDPPPDGGYPNQNTAEGEDALFSLFNGFNNTAVGFQALFSNTKGHDNTSVGYKALNQNTSGDFNTASGLQALYSNTAGRKNTGHGFNALYANTTGSNNTAIGNYALSGNTTGRNNIGVGASAGSALSTGSRNIDIGNPGIAGDSNTIRIGDLTHFSTFIAGISGVTVAGGVGVIVDTTGHLGTVTSSARYKKNIHPMNNASQKLLSLHPVTFEYKEELDPHRIPQFGLVAEDVAKVDPDLVARDEQGKPYTVRYDAVNAMLLNEFLKAHKRVEEQEARLTDQTKEIAELKAALEKMSARLDANGL